MNQINVETSSDLIRGLRRELGLSQQELSRRTWTERALIARIELGREPRLPSLRRLIVSLGGRLELAARFERPLEALAADFLRERDEWKAIRLAERRRAYPIR